MRKKSKILSLVILIFLSAELNSQTIWQKSWGGANVDNGSSICMTSDGGFIIAGGTLSFGAGQADMYLIKIDSLGNTQWTKTYGGAGDEAAKSVRQTSDGGYILAGGTTSFGAGMDVYLVRTNSLGDTLWTKSIRGYSDQSANCLQITHDRGFIIAKYTPSWFSLLKTDSLGNVQWDSTYVMPFYPGSGINWVEQTIDGGFICTGNVLVQNQLDIRLVKTDALGKVLWQKLYLAPTEDYAASVLQTPDGNYMVTGTINNTAAGSDILLLKTDALGNKIWTKTFGGRYDEEGYFIVPMNDGNYVLGGSTDSYGTNRYEAWLVKINPEGTILGSSTAGGVHEDCVVSGVKTGNGRVVIAGYTSSFGAGSDDVYAAKININQPQCPLLVKLNEYFHFYDGLPLQSDIYNYPTRSQKTHTNDPSLLDSDDLWVLLMYPEKLSFMSNNNVNGEIDLNDWYMIDQNNIDEISFDISHFGGYLPFDIKEMLTKYMNVEIVNGPWYINADTILQTNGNIDTVTATYPIYKKGELAGKGKMTVWYDYQKQDLQGKFYDYVLDFTDTISFNPILSVDTLKVKIPLLPDSVQVIHEKIFNAYNLRSMARMKAPANQNPFPTILDVTPQAFLLSYLVEAKINSLFTLHAPFMDFEIDTAGNLNCLLEAVLSIYDFLPGETINSPVFPDQFSYSGIEVFPPLINIWVHNYLESPFTKNKLHYQRILGNGTINSTLPAIAKQSQYLSVLGEGPVNLELTDPEGLIIKKAVNNISNTKYVEADVNGDLKIDDFILLPYAKPNGSYSIKVIAEEGALPTDIYTLRAAFKDTIITLAQNVLISNIPSNPYILGPIYVGIGDEAFDNQIPGTFKLYQNYPNPFNPGTTIKFSIPKASIVVLKLFDILGREVETLINEEKPAGTYQAIWNAVNVPSGIYFYRIQTDSFIETKKMILLK